MAYSRPRTPTELAEQRATLLNDTVFWRAINDLALLNPSLGDAPAIHDSLRTAALWWIGSDCCDLLAQAAPTMPPVTLDPDAVPDVDGFAFLEHPLTGQDAWNPDSTVSFDAIHWQPTIIQGLPCLSIIMWRHANDPDLPPVPLGRTDWPFGFDTDFEPDGVPPESLASIIEDRRLLAALWQLTSQPELVATAEERPYRAAAKRIARMGHTPSAVRLVYLNRKNRRRSPDATTGRRFNHQWIVRPHWRQQPYGPQRSLRRATYIDQHVKGPADKPLRLRPSVKVWTKP